MFNVQLVIKELGIDEINLSPSAKDAKGANPKLKVSTISTVSTTHVPENHVSSSQEKAERLIDSIQYRDDRVFVRQCLIGIYGTKRLGIVNKYFEQLQLGSEAEPNKVKKDNAGRYRANVWIRDRNNTFT